MHADSTLTIPRKVLLNALKTVSRIAVYDRTMRDRLVRLTTRDDIGEGNHLAVYASQPVGNAIAVAIDVGPDHDCPIDSSFPITPLKRWLALANDDVTIKSTETHLIMMSGTAIVKFKKHDADEVGIVPDTNDQRAFCLDSADLRSIIKRVAFCAARGGVRAVMEGILFSTNEDHLTIHAADGFRLAKYVIECFAEESQFMIPGDSIRELDRVLSRYGTDDVAIWHSDTSITFAVNGVVLALELTKGTPPGYAAVIDKITPTSSITLQSDVLCSALKRLGVGAPWRDVPFIDVMAISDATIHLRLGNGVSGNDYIEMLNCTIAGDVPGIRLNGAWLAEIAARFETVTIEFQSNSDPIRITGDVIGLMYVQMPMHVARAEVKNAA